MSNEPEILKGLFGADAVEEFLRDYWPDRIFVAKGDKGRLPAALLDGDLNEFDVLSRRYKGVVSFFGDDKSNHMVPVEGIDAAAPYRCGLSVYQGRVCQSGGIRFTEKGRNQLPLRFRRRVLHPAAGNQEVRSGTRQ
jgi:hypothetical protein